jgi:hypothetical protein
MIGEVNKQEQEERIAYWESLWRSATTPKERQMVSVLARESGEEQECQLGLMRSSYPAPDDSMTQ